MAGSLSSHFSFSWAYGSCASTSFEPGHDSSRILVLCFRKSPRASISVASALAFPTAEIRFDERTTRRSRGACEKNVSVAIMQLAPDRMMVY
jgi:hypothetical protein